jgi:hypothetical protein
MEGSAGKLKPMQMQMEVSFSRQTEAENVSSDRAAGAAQDWRMTMAASGADTRAGVSRASSGCQRRAGGRAKGGTKKRRTDLAHADGDLRVRLDRSECERCTHTHHRSIRQET